MHTKEIHKLKIQNANSYASTSVCSVADIRNRVKVRRTLVVGFRQFACAAAQCTQTPLKAQKNVWLIQIRGGRAQAFVLAPGLLA
jgi:hypothetical protein